MLNKLWNTNAPSKILIFGRRLLLNWLHTRDALASRGIVSGTPNLACPFCLSGVESIARLFAECRKVLKVWGTFFLWMDISCHTQLEGSDTYFSCFFSSLKGRVNKKLRLLVWLVVYLSIWISKNEMVFKGASFRVEDLVCRAKVLSCDWFVARSKFTFDCC